MKCSTCLFYVPPVYRHKKFIGMPMTPKHCNRGCWVENDEGCPLWQKNKNREVENWYKNIEILGERK